ncbi:MAG: hypothetical protein ORN23_01965 [Chthoniobacterales bacterium]|nr:hypothetical protein [Chthoniobacterales bacterium]
MFEEFSDGLCPHCLLSEKDNPMRINRRDNWECPECHLCAVSPKPLFIVRKKKGMGNFRETVTLATEKVAGFQLCIEGPNGYLEDDYTPVKSEDELRDFLSKVS